MTRIVFLVAERRTHLENWAREQKLDLKRHPNLRFVWKPDQIYGIERHQLFTVITHSRAQDPILQMLRERQHAYIPSDINQWPLDVFA